MAQARGIGGKISDLLSHARKDAGIAADCILALQVDREDTDNTFDRQFVGAVLTIEHWAEMKAMRQELRSFLKAMSKSR